MQAQANATFAQQRPSIIEKARRVYEQTASDTKSPEATPGDVMLVVMDSHAPSLDGWLQSHHAVTTADKLESLFKS